MMFCFVWDFMNEHYKKENLLSIYVTLAFYVFWYWILWENEGMLAKVNDVLHNGQ